MRCPHYTHWAISVCRDTSRRVACRLCVPPDTVPPFDRFRVAQMVCDFCYCCQPAGAACVNPECTARGVVHRYYCATCHLWEHASRTLFHCDACGICRVGAPEQYRHCDACGMCVPTRPSRPDWDTRRDPVRDTHHCVGGAAVDNPCPVCYEDLAASVDPATFLACGHAVHVTCLNEWARHGGGACPVCRQ